MKQTKPLLWARVEIPRSPWGCTQRFMVSVWKSPQPGFPGQTERLAQYNRCFDDERTANAFRDGFMDERDGRKDLY